MGQPHRLCPASPRARAGGARRGGAGGRVVEGSARTAPGGGWQSGGVQRTRSAGGLARVRPAVDSRRCGKVGLGAPLFAVLPLRTPTRAWGRPEGTILEPRLNAGIGRGRGGRRLPRTVGRCISESRCDRPAPRALTGPTPFQPKPLL